MKKKYILAEPVVNAKEVIKLANKVLSSNFFNEGKYTKLVEKKISNLLKVRYAVATTSGTVSLFLALKSIGIKKNDEIIIPNILSLQQLTQLNLLVPNQYWLILIKKIY